VALIALHGFKDEVEAYHANELLGELLALPHAVHPGDMYCGPAPVRQEQLLLLVSPKRLDTREQPFLLEV
jgi:hypothetical protein